MLARCVIGCVLLCSLYGRLRADEEQVVQAIQAAGGLVLKISADSDDREVAFQLAGNKAGDAQLKLVAQLSNVIWLNLAGTSVSDAGMADIAGLTGLEKLHLERTQIGDAGLVHLANLQQLQYLNLYGTKVTDLGLEKLRGLKSLKKLYLWQTAVTDAGVQSLSESIPGLEIVLAAKLDPPPPPEIPPPPPVQPPPNAQGKSPAPTNPVDGNKSPTAEPPK